MNEGTRYTNAGLLPLTDIDLRKQCPAIFSEAPRSDVSSRYGFVSSKTILDAMRAAGFVCTQTLSYSRRDEQIRGFTKHMMRFRQAGDNLKKLIVGDVVPQIVCVNSHDRSSQFHLFGGLWRLICSNGMLVSDGARVTPLVVRHTTSAVDGLLDAAGLIIKQHKFVFEHVDEMRATELTEKQAREFAVRTLALRPERAGVIDPMQLLNVRRPEDNGPSLWQVFNRAQENMTRGGLQGITANNRAIVTRGITAINGDIALNAGMWRIAMEMRNALEKASKSSAAVARKSRAKPAAPEATPAPEAAPAA